jgi:uncharacterized membrane protein
MFESLIGTIVFVALLVTVFRQQSRLKRVERELVALRGLVLSGLPAANAGAELARRVASGGEAAQAAVGAVSPAAMATEAMPDEKAEIAPVGATESAPAEADAEKARVPQADDTPLKPTRPSRKPDIETALGTRWAVWVGGLALALGGLFLVRYTIESGVFGPQVRLAMAAILGLVLVGGGEFIRRTGFKVPVEGMAGAYIPAILTAAGAFTLFGTVYAAHAVYGFVAPAAAFLLLGLIGVGTIAAALVHGLALAGVGLLGALATPLLIDTQSHNDWALFGYLAIVLVATGFVARIRAWSFLAAAAFIGTGLWTLFYIGVSAAPDVRIVLFIGAVTLAVLVFAWLRRSGRSVEGETGFDWPSIAPAFFVGLSAVALALDPYFGTASGTTYAATLVVAMLAAALVRVRALPVLYGAGLATGLIYLDVLPTAVEWLDFSAGSLAVDGTPVVLSPNPLTGVGVVLGVLFAAAGFWAARRFIRNAWHSASWAGWGVAVPLFILLTLWIGFGDIDIDLNRAAVAALLAVVFACAAEWIARAEEPPLAGGPGVSAALVGAGLALLLFLHMAFGSGMTTVLAGAAAILPALATRWRSYPALGWLSVGAVIAVICRVAFDPTIVGAEFLSKTPVFNWLLPGYGIPALAFGFAAWQLARTTNGRPRLAMEAGAALFALLTVAMLMRHAMHGGVIDTGALTLAEQAIYTLLALGFAAILVAIDSRSPSSVLRYGSLGVGVLSVLAIAGNHFIWLNPLFTDESTGGIPVFNLLFLAYLLPAVAAGGLALYARGKRPRWYSAMLALVAALLAFTYATLSIRRIFKGEFIGLWSGLGQLETYSYSALWLALGVVLLVLGVVLASQVLRIASAALIAVAVLKVFLFDMSELEGVLRALSFIGLGAVLIGIGLFYQRLLTRAKPRETAEASPT